MPLQISQSFRDHHICMRHMVTYHITIVPPDFLNIEKGTHQHDFRLITIPPKYEHIYPHRSNQQKQNIRNFTHIIIPQKEKIKEKIRFLSINHTLRLKKYASCEYFTPFVRLMKPKMTASKGILAVHSPPTRCQLFTHKNAENSNKQTTKEVYTFLCV